MSARAPSAQARARERERARPRKLPVVLAATLLAGLLAGCTGTPIDPIDPSAYTFALFADGFEAPVAITPGPPDADPGSVYVVEQAGVVWRVAPNGSRDATPFMDIRDQVGIVNWEQGLLNLAFHPDFADNGRILVLFTDPQFLERGVRQARHEIALVQYTVADNGTVDPDSADVLLRVQKPQPEHNGGGLAFDSKGNLFVSFGDGQSYKRTWPHAQSLDLFLGKVLRIRVDGESGYTVPASNPFVGKEGADEIWALGLRNPWRIHVDPATDDLWIGDVGWNDAEEIDRIPADRGGLNFGWPKYEGHFLIQPYEPQTGLVTPPVFAYPHTPTKAKAVEDPSLVSECAITGGPVYRGTALPELWGAAFAGDYCNGRTWIIRADDGGGWTDQSFIDTPFVISSFGTDGTGELLVADQSGGAIHRLVSAPAS